MRPTVSLLLFLCVIYVQAQDCTSDILGCCQQGPDGTCLQCQQYFYKNSMNQCGLYKPVAHCLVYNMHPPFNCEQCSNQLFERVLDSEGKCVLKSKFCRQMDKQGGRCSQCLEGYILSNQGSCWPKKLDGTDCQVGLLPLFDFCFRSDQYCTQIDESNGSYGVCTACRENYKLFHGTCIHTNSTESPCEGCECEGLEVGGTCIQTVIPNCAYKVDEGFCGICNTNFTLGEGHECLQSISTNDSMCTNVNENLYCTQCQRGYFLNENKFCVRNFSCTDNEDLYCKGKHQLCELIDYTTNQCKACRIGYQLEGQDCLIRRKCLREDSNTQQCLQCRVGYQLDKDHNACVQMPINCQEINITTGDCINCQSPRVLRDVGGVVICVLEDDRCVEYSAYGFCKACIEGYFVQDVFCQPIARNCVQLVENNLAACRECEAGFHLNPLTLLCFSEVTFCIQYNYDTNQCKQCSSNTYLFSTNIQPPACVQKDQYCLSMDQMANCIECSDGYLPYRNLCVFYDPYCARYQNRVCVQVLQEAQKYFTLSSFSAADKTAYLNTIQQSKGGFIKTLPYSGVRSSVAQKWSMNGEMVSCLGSAKLINGICAEGNQQPCTSCSQSRCSEYSVYGVCSQCSTGIVWGRSCVLQNCVDNSKCQSCKGGFHFYHGLCVPNRSPNCLAYDLTNDICMKCTEEYYITTLGQCKLKQQYCLTTNPDTQRCEECIQYYKLANDRCVFEVENCYLYDGQGKCERCRFNIQFTYELLNNNSCLVLPQRCRKLDKDTGLCSQCFRGYTFRQEQNLCVVLKDHCLEYDESGCITCEQFYVLNQNTCRFFMPYCRKGNSQQLCTQCYDGFQLTNGECYPNDDFCLLRAEIGVFCESCVDGYQWNPQFGLCSLIPQGCETFDFVSGRCLDCLPQFYLIDEWCILKRIIDNGCKDKGQYVDTPECLSCMDGFFLNITNRQCYAQNCVGYDIAKNCKGCKVYFTFSQLDPRYCIPTFCLRYQFSTSTCLLEKPSYRGGFTLTHPNQLEVTFCVRTLQNGTCVECEPYRYPSFTQYGLCYPSNCLNSEYTCTKCNVGFDLQADGICLASHCKTYSSMGVCTECKSLYRLTLEGTCQNAQFCQQVDPVTQQCICAEYYSFNRQLQSCTVDNCILPTQNCPQCLNGFELQQDGTCRIQGCLVHLISQTDTCRTCQNGMIRNDANGLCIPQYCNKYAYQPLRCEQCFSGFALQQVGENIICVAQNCAQFVSYVCAACMPYYNLTPDNKCIKNCFRFADDLQTCLQCPFGFTLSYDSNLCLPYDSFCEQKDLITQICIRCQDNYILNSLRKCVYPIYGCLQYSREACSWCQSAYYLNQYQYCTPKNCLQAHVSNVSQCLQCDIGMQLVQGVCTPSNCEVFSQTRWYCTNCYGRFENWNAGCRTRNCRAFALDNYTCVECEPLYSLVNGSCLLSFCKEPRDLFCDECIAGYRLNYYRQCQRDCLTAESSTGECLSCEEGKKVQNGFCVIDDDLCLFREASGQCRQCPANYYIDSNGRDCRGYHCIDWDAVNQRCRQCFPNFQVIEGLCVSELCTQYENITGYVLPQCRRCVANYLPYDVHCVPVNCEIDAYDMQEDRCTNCSFGYEWINNACLLKYCTSYSQVGGQPDYTDCRQCENRFKKFGELCLANNCSNFRNTTCLECFQGFTYRNQRCFTNQCMQESNEGICITCTVGYTIAENKTCLINRCMEQVSGNCVQCDSGWLLGNDGKCNPVNCAEVFTNKECNLCAEGYVKDRDICVDPGCKTFDGIFTCTQCRQHFLLNQGRCERQQTICPMGKYFDLVLGVCAEVGVPGCRYVVSAQKSVCLMCDTGFFLLEGKCFTTRFCTLYSYFQGCFSCVSGYTLISTFCVPFDPNCLSYRDTSCVACVQGYQVNQSNGLCQESVQLPPNCLQYDYSAGHCARCVQGYVLAINGQCRPTNCDQYDSITLVCEKCSNRYYVNEYGTCSAYPPYCSNFDVASFTCFACFPPYILTDTNDCIYNPIPNCLQFDTFSQLCLRCSSGYILDAGYCIAPTTCPQGRLINNICYPNIASCQRYASNPSVCESCQSGYRLTNNACIRLIDNCLDQDGLTCSRCKPYFYHSAARDSCEPYPPFCTNVDPSGICISCCPKTLLSAGRCIAEPDRLTNCAAFDTQNKCTSCIGNFQYCPKCDICLPKDPNCIRFDGNDCVVCRSPWKQINGRCLLDPPGRDLFANGLICERNYIRDGSHCYRNKTFLTQTSKLRNIQFYSHEGDIRSKDQGINSERTWVSYNVDPVAPFFGFRTETPQIIYAISIQGGGNVQGWVKSFIIQFKNKDAENSPFICWNSCLPIQGNTESSTPITLDFDYPIIAENLRIYPLSWESPLSMRMDAWVE